MPEKYYDVVVIGRSIGALAAAALLSRRDFTVLVVGHGRPSADYEFDGVGLRRRGFTMLAARSPSWRRLTSELAWTQTWNRRTTPLDPMLQVLMAGHRLNVPPDAEHFGREVEREFPAWRRRVADLYGNFARVTAAADEAFGEEAQWPPGTFFERRRTARLASSLPYAQAEPHADLLAEFPRHHPYRRVVDATVRFGTDLAAPVPAFAVARLHGSWTRGLVAVPGGEDALTSMLLERVEANGGVHFAGDRIARLDVRRGNVCHVTVDGDEAPVGAGWVLTDVSGEALAGLAGGGGVSKRAQREWPRVVPTTGRFVVSLVVRRRGLPEPLAQEFFLLDEGGAALHVERSPAAGISDAELLVAEVLRGERDRLPRERMRAHVVARLCAELPFLERHLLIVDSPHDGLPLWRYRREGATVARPALVPRTHLTGGHVRAEPMVRQFEVDPVGYLGLAGEPLRGPLPRTLLVGPTVLPGLGQEGQLLAAWGATRLVTQSDRRKARMRREMWTKLEIT
ncbi:MAG: phytoene dehydrogenase [Myxococcota bacterium]